MDAHVNSRMFVSGHGKTRALFAGPARKAEGLDTRSRRQNRA